VSVPRIPVGGNDRLTGFAEEIRGCTILAESSATQADLEGMRRMEAAHRTTLSEWMRIGT